MCKPLATSSYTKWIISLTIFAVLAAPLAAQEGAKSSDEKKSDTKAAAKDDGADQGAAKAGAAKAGPARAEFEKVFTKWKGILQELRKLRTEYQTAATKDVPAIEKRWNELIKEGEALLPTIRQAALAAYKEAPNQDPALTRFLVKLMNDLMARDDYEPALEIAIALDENNAGYDEVLKVAGTAAYSLNQFDLAEKYLERAQQAGVLPADSAQLRADVKTCAELWKKEQELRKKEAEADDLPRVKLTTTKGDIVIELFENEAPETVGNFISLVEKGFYNGLTFHRVISGFMAQAGCPVGDGTGGPGYTIYDECYKPEHRNHFAGSVSMAKTAARNTGGSQFFICMRPTPHLNGKHTVFGRVIEGMDVVQKLVRRTPNEPGNEPADKIISAEVIRKRDHEYKPHKVE